MGFEFVFPGSLLCGGKCILACIVLLRLSLCVFVGLLIYVADVCCLFLLVVLFVLWVVMGCVCLCCGLFL